MAWEGGWGGGHQASLRTWGVNGALTGFSAGARDVCGAWESGKARRREGRKEGEMWAGKRERRKVGRLSEKGEGSTEEGDRNWEKEGEKGGK